FDGALSVGELEVSRRNQRFAGGQNRERPDLPNNVGSRAGIDARLNHGDDKKRGCGHKQTGADFSQWRQTNKFLHERVEPIGKQRQHDQYEKWVDRLNLRREPLDAEKTSIHRLGLNDPRRKILLPQRPEDRYERNRDKNVQQNFDRLLVENLARVRPQTSRRNVDEFLSAGPKENRRDDHEDTREAECHDWAVKSRTFEKTYDAWRQGGDKSTRRSFVWFE